MEPRELDAALAERLFPWSDETRLCHLAWSWISETGQPFVLKDGSKIFCPAGKTLPQPEGNENWNSRYALYIGKQLLHEGKITTNDVRNVKTDRPGLSTTGDGMLKVLKAMRERGFDGEAHLDAKGLPHAMFTKEHYGDYWECADTLPRAVALAALAALGQ